MEPILYSVVYLRAQNQGLRHLMTQHTPGGICKRLHSHRTKLADLVLSGSQMQPGKENPTKILPNFYLLGGVVFTLRDVHLKQMEHRQ